LAVGETAGIGADRVHPALEFAHRRVLIARQQFEHTLARPRRAVVRNVDLHPFRGFAQARSGEHPLSLDLDHAGTAIAVRPVSRRLAVT
jgi:hypothetical protein